MKIRKTVVWSGKAWYGSQQYPAPHDRQLVDEFVLGVELLSDNHREGQEPEANFEFLVNWHVHARGLTPRLCIYSDAFRCLVLIPEFFQWLAEVDTVSREDFMKQVLKMGFEDETPYKRSQ